MNTQHTNRALPVAITGLGAVTPYGNNVETFRQAIMAGKHAFVPIRLFETDKHRTKTGAEIRKMPELKLNRLDKNTLSRCDLLALTAASEALKHSRLLDESKSCVPVANRIGILVGTAAGSILGVERFFRKRTSGQSVASSLPELTSFCLSAIATHIAREFVIEGPRMTIATVCSSSGLALAAAKELLETDDLDAVLVVGAETLSEVSHAGFNSLRSIAVDRCRPFDLNRKGLILGEGAGAILLERVASAKTRNVPISAFLRGYGLTTDIHHFTAPQPEGKAIAATIVQAMTDAALDPEQIVYVNAHGTGTKLNDIAETLGLRSALGTHADTTLVSSTKSMIGHQMGAASILEAVATVMSIENGEVHPTANLETPDPKCDLDYATDGARSCDFGCALSNSFAFGGSNISLAFSKDSKKNDMAVRPEPEQAIRPVITGIGLASPIGIGKEEFLQAVNKGKEGITSLEAAGEEWAGLRGAMVDMSAVNGNTPPAIRRRLNRQTSFLFVSFKEAMEDAGISIEKVTSQDAISKDPTSIVYGSAFGCSGNVHRFYSRLLKDGPKFVSPMEFNMSVTNAPPSLIAHEFGLKGPIWVFVADETSWDISLHWAAKQIRTGKSDRIAVCAAEEINESVLAIHQELGLLETKEQKGLLPGEGAVCMIIESERAALKRGAEICGTITEGCTVQDSTCGPQDYSPDAKHLIRAAAGCVQKISEKNGNLLCISPDNGSPTLEKVSRDTIDELHQLWGNTSTVNFQSFFGTSGISGGLGLAAALLGKNYKSASHIMVLTAGRGGINAATVVRTDLEIGHSVWRS